jgi:hypothetical protein
MMLFNNYVALDISSSEIRAVAVSMGKIKKWASATVPQGVVKAGLIRDPKTLGVIIDSLFRIYHLKKGRVITTVSGLPFIYRTVSMPNGGRVPTEALERESRREMAIAKEDMYIAWQLTEKRSTAGESDYFVVGIPRTSLNPVIEALAAAEIRPYSIDIKPLALARAAARPEALIVSLEEDLVDIVLVAAGLVRVIYSFNLNEKSGRVNEIVAGLTKAIKAFERDFPNLALSPETAVLFSGQNGADDPLLKQIGDTIGREVKMISPDLAVPAGMSAGAYTAILGLVSQKRLLKEVSPGAALRPGSAYRDINVDLLSGFKRAHPPRFQMIFVVAAVIALVLAALVFKTFDLKQDAAQEVFSLQETASMASHNLALAQAENQAGLKARQGALAGAEAVSRQLETITHLNDMIASQRLDYAARVATITDAAKDGAQFNNIDFEQSKIIVVGTALNGFDVLDMVAEMEKSPYFSSVKVDKLSPDTINGVRFTLTINSKTTVEDLSGGKVQ